MSTNEETPKIVTAALVPYHSDIAEKEVGALATGVTVWLESTKSKTKFKETVKHPDQLQALVNTVGAFIQLDQSFEGGASKIGQILSNVLKQEYNEQLAFIRVMCETQGIQLLRDKDEKETVGKAGLKWALFGAYPELWKKSGKDTLAGKRFWYYLSLAKEKKRLTGGGRKAIGAGKSDPETRIGKETGSTAPTMTGEGLLWGKLYAVANEKEQHVLCAITARAGIAYEDWIPAPPPAGPETPAKPVKPAKGKE